jgi:hypothetical protein
LRASLVVKKDLALSLLYRTGLFASVLLAVLADRRWIPSSTIEGLITEHQTLTARLTVFRQSRESLESAIGEPGASDVSR